MSTIEPSIRLRLIGPLNVSDDKGRDLTPKGAKNQGLVAILALSPGMSRPRRWVEDKLWSAFAPEQASANLRQALAKLRQALGESQHVLLADRGTIGFDPGKVSVDVLEGAFDHDMPHELLEGLDVRDAEFEDWLRAERSRHATRLEADQPAEIGGLLMRCRTTVHDDSTVALIGEVLANQIGENISEQVRAWRQSGRHADEAGDVTGDLEISCDLLQAEAGTRVYIRVIHVPTARILYSKLHVVRDVTDILTSEAAISAVVFEAADRTLAMLPQTVEKGRPEARATLLSRFALYRMFSFEPDALREADRLLSQAYSVDQNGVYTAWRSLIRTIQMIELFEPDGQALREEMLELNHRALEEGADNALVQALLSQVRIMALGDAHGGLDLAQQSVERNPTSGFGWLSLSVSRMLAGDPKEAIAVSQKARDIARFSPFKQWWDLYHCIVCVACDRPHLAIEAGEAAARAAPSFRPAQRHLIALYAMDGQYERALAAAERLKKIEPGFTLDRFVNDDSYPVRTLRSKGMLEPVRALL